SGDMFENYRADITPTSVELVDEYHDKTRDRDYEPKEEVFVKLTVNIKNTDDKEYPIKKIKSPSMAVYDSEELTDLTFQNNTFDEEIEKSGKELTVEDELAPDE